MGGIKSHIIIIFYRMNKITPITKNKGRKKNEGRNISEEKK